MATIMTFILQYSPCVISAHTYVSLIWFEIGVRNFCTDLKETFAVDQNFQALLQQSFNTAGDVNLIWVIR